MIGPFRQSTGKKQRTTRLRIFVWAFILSAIAGAISLPEPLEDIYRGGRNLVRARPADQSVVVVGIDDRTIQALGDANRSRTYDVKLVDTLFARGARRVYYDKVFADLVDPVGDAAFAAALSRHQGRVFLGAMTIYNRQGATQEIVLPAAPFVGRAPYRSLKAFITPFSLSAELFFANQIGGKEYPGIAADVAGVKGSIDEHFRPDWSIQMQTVPTISYLDVVNGTASPVDLHGKDVLVGITAGTSSDWLQVAGQDWFPGVYGHAIGAQTLREGRPRNIGWIPVFLTFGAFAAALLRTRSRRRGAGIAVAAVGCGLIAPFALDIVLVKADFMPGYLLFGIAAFRAISLRDLAEARTHNAGTLMPNLEALREEQLASIRPIVAMRIRNYAAINASFADPVDDELVSEIARRLTMPGEATTFYQAEDVLYWLGPVLPQSDLSAHLEGLARLLESQFVVRDRKIDIYLAFGVDMDFSRPVANRIGRALLAADNAAAEQKLMLFNTGGNDDDSAWELSLMSELDAAIDAGDIWIAYQPQFNLRDDRITGAEALVRWQHPTRGAISPEAFILPAEAHNRINRLTFHILEKSTRDAKSIVARNPLFRLSVNLSANLLQLPGLPALITEIIVRTGFPASNLTIEVTESAPFKEHELVKRNLAGIAALGIDLSIDDYGTGNATLEYLRSVPCQEIKIDRRFVSGLVTNASDMLLVESTIELAHGLGRRVIAEGIEDPETLQLLRTIGCDLAQGYYLAKPMRLEALESLLAASAHIRAA